ncbi:hypothetical protein [Dyadobacter psychrophilus]|uniref:HEAT repeat-containing protein n=1 Tax=Dyadobacter psychrophilus TaxID=651661 RepID=A0A1T5FH18_9BACT|nr:hypothetical protein [Dyadobacter psychrophilus]SKB95406.1 hypothetical protein SAMN05660293_03202 [Dyadobacter psychrophilus]
MLCQTGGAFILIIMPMNIRSALLADPMQSKRRASEVAAYACLDSAHFDELMDCFLSDNFRLAQRAAYSVSIAGSERPDLIEPHIGSLVDQLKRKDIHDAVIRNSARILQEVEVPEELHGRLMDVCFDFIQNRQIAIAIRAFSLTILYNFSRIYPEIKKELRIIIEEALEYEKPAFVSRGKKILKKI